MPLPPLDDVEDLDAHHLLVLPAGIGRVRALSVPAPVGGAAWQESEPLLTGTLPAD